MVKGIYLAAQNLDSTLKKMGNIANNLANINTTGFKRTRPFSEVLESTGDVKIDQRIDWAQGDLMETSNPLDSAINGKGFFAVMTDSGMRFTRSGRFKINEEGNLLDVKGNKVMGINGEVVVPTYSTGNDNTISINKEGEIKMGNQYVDTLLVADGSNLNNFLMEGNDYFKTADGSYEIADPSTYSVEQGYIESSNVNAIYEMESMINISNNYESAQRMVNFLDQTLAKSQEIGKVF